VLLLSSQIQISTQEQWFLWLIENKLLLLQSKIFDMEFSAQQIAEFLGGKVDGDSAVKVSDFSKIEDGKQGTLSFLSNSKYAHYIYDSEASIVLVNNDFQPERAVKPTMVRVDNAYESLALLMSLVEKASSNKTGISPLSFVSSSAKLGENVYVAPFVFIGERVVIGDNTMVYANVSIDDDTTVGNDCILYSGAKVYNKCVIGNNCTLHAGVVIGADGFGFAPTADGSYKKIPQLGNVILEDNVEIGANATVDRATMGSTIIRKGVKLDNLVQVAHNGEVGINTVIAAQSGVAGSSKVGKQCIIAAQVGIAGHITIADGSIIGGQAGVNSTVKQPNQKIQGSPAIPMSNFQRSSIVFKNLPEIQKTISALQKQIQELENKINSIT
jgi:UDP-3-O-[3-hydroxymyristoyl] glucosamine N-acyltransferase